MVQGKRIREVMHAVDCGNPLAFQKAGHLRVGQDHEVFNEAVTLYFLRRPRVCQPPTGIPDELRLSGFDAECPFLPAPSLQVGGQGTPQIQRRSQSIRGLLLTPEHLLQFHVIQAGIAPDERAVETRTPHGTIRADVHLNSNRLPVLPGDQGAYPGGQCLRKHVFHAGGDVDGSPPPQGLPVQRRALFHVVGDVRHMHIDYGILALLGERQGVVEVPGGGRIHRESEQLSKILPGALLLSTAPANLLSFRQNFRPNPRWTRPSSRRASNTSCKTSRRPMTLVTCTLRPCDGRKRTRSPVFTLTPPRARRKVGPFWKRGSTSVYLPRRDTSPTWAPTRERTSLACRNRFGAPFFPPCFLPFPDRLPDFLPRLIRRRPGVRNPCCATPEPVYDASPEVQSRRRMSRGRKSGRRSGKGKKQGGKKGAPKRFRQAKDVRSRVGAQVGLVSLRGKYTEVEPLFQKGPTFLLARGGVRVKTGDLVLFRPSHGRRVQVTKVIGRREVLQDVLDALLEEGLVQRGFGREVLAEAEQVGRSGAPP